MAVGDIFCALACRARLVLATAEQATNPAALRRLIADARHRRRTTLLLPHL
jgi:hypothetical protein